MFVGWGLGRGQMWGTQWGMGATMPRACRVWGQCACHAILLRFAGGEVCILPQDVGHVPSPHTCPLTPPHPPPFPLPPRRELVVNQPATPRLCPVALDSFTRASSVDLERQLSTRMPQVPMSTQQVQEENRDALMTARTGSMGYMVSWAGRVCAGVV
jgi:hypothetical protein